MIRVALALVACALFSAKAVAEWRAEIIATPGPVWAVEQVENAVAVLVANAWHRVQIAEGKVTLARGDAPTRPPVPAGALPDARVTIGKRDIARAWLASPTTRYGHGVLGDAIEAESLVVELRDGARRTLRLGAEAVFEDIEPRLADLDGDGRDEIIVVKSYLDRGSALAVAGIRNGELTILAETPPIGRPNAWLNPAGFADFDGDGQTDIAFVRQPHVVGALELWTWRDGRLAKKTELRDTSNHAIGSRVLAMSAVADVDGDGAPDLAVPSLDRQSLRIVAFRPQPRDIARVALPARVVTAIAVARDDKSRPIAILATADRQLIAVRNFSTTSKD